MIVASLRIFGVTVLEVVVNGYDDIEMEFAALTAREQEEQE